MFATFQFPGFNAILIGGHTSQLVIPYSSVCFSLWHISIANIVLVSFLFKDLDFTETGLLYLILLYKQFLTRIKFINTN